MPVRLPSEKENFIIVKENPQSRPSINYSQLSNPYTSQITRQAPSFIAPQVIESQRRPSQIINLPPSSPPSHLPVQYIHQVTSHPQQYQPQQQVQMYAPRQFRPQESQQKYPQYS